MSKRNNSQQIEKIEAELEKRTPARGLIKLGVDYFQAYRILVELKPNFGDLYDVKYYLICHAFELGIKGYLKKHGYSRKRLKSINHDLVGLIFEVQKCGFIFDKIDISLISSVNRYYNSKQFEYIFTGYRAHADLTDLEPVIEKLIKSFGVIVDKNFVS